jgi:hypothetical protein
MNGGGSRGDRGRYPDGRARQPGQQDRRDLPARGGIPMRSDARQTRPGPQRGSRSRVAAVVVLLVVAVIIVVVGVTLGKGDGSSGSGQSIPFNLLPFPENAVTSTTQ